MQISSRDRTLRDERRLRIDRDPLLQLTPEQRKELLEKDPRAANELLELLYQTPSLYGKALKLACLRAEQNPSLQIVEGARRGEPSEEVRSAPQIDGLLFCGTFKAAFLRFQSGEGRSFCAFFSECLRRALEREIYKEDTDSHYVTPLSERMKRIRKTVKAINDKRIMSGLPELNLQSETLIRAVASELDVNPTRVRTMLKRIALLEKLDAPSADEDNGPNEPLELNVNTEESAALDPQAVFADQERAQELLEAFQILSLREKELQCERYGDLYSDFILRFLRGNRESASGEQRLFNIHTVAPLVEQGLFWGRLMRQDYAEFLLSQPPELNTVPPLAFNPLKDPALKPSNTAVARYRLKKQPDNNLHREEVGVSRDAAKLNRLYCKMFPSDQTE